MNMDKLMAQSLRYFLLRDVLLLLLIFTQFMITFRLIANLQPIFFIIIGLSAIVWLGYYLKSVGSYFKAKKDRYLKEAIKDEYIERIVYKSSYHGYASMFITCSFFVIIGLFLSCFSVHFEIPYYLASEVILLIGIITGDISKAIQVRE